MQSILIPLRGGTLERVMNEGIKLAVELLGSNNALAEKLGVSAAAVSMWKNGERQVGPKHCKAIERLTKRKVKAADLRPDVFC